jgi:asparagine synthase (glutamine-hydrolysing)
MAHSVEGRYPFLDHRVVEFCSRLPANLKLRGLTEKYLLKQLGRKWLPQEIWRRPKRPYRSPIQHSFFNEKAQDYVCELLSPESLETTGLFSPTAVAQLVRKAEQGKPLGETGDMALVGIVSTQLLHRQFIEKLRLPQPLSEVESVRVRLGSRET